MMHASRFMIHDSRSWVDYIRSRPLYQRHLIMWGGSLLLFLVVVWLWMAQVKAQLASLNMQGPFASSAPSQLATTTEKPAPSVSVVDEFSASLKAIGNAFASLFSHSFAPAPSPSVQPLPEAPLHQGDELNQYVPAQPFPDN